MSSAYDITHPVDDNFADVETISQRSGKAIAIEIVEYQPSWPNDFEILRSRIQSALGDRALRIEHVGSTSVPGMPAKANIDIDVTVADATAEDTYVPDLEAAGFQFLLRQPKWYDHRFFGSKEPYGSIHVFRLGSSELERHRIFRDYLREHEDERVVYAQVKREAAAASHAAGEVKVMEYNIRKEKILREILQRAFKANGLLD